MPWLWAIHVEESRRPLADLCRALCVEPALGLQLRHKSTVDRSLLDLCRVARAALPAGPLTVTTRADLARLADLDGVHLPADGLPVSVARAILGPQGLVGRSTHDLEEVARARDEGADFVYFGPVFATPSKPGAAGVGIDRLSRACRLGLPVFALGGILPARLRVVAEAGAVGAAGIRLFEEGELQGLAACARQAFGPGEAS